MTADSALLFRRQASHCSNQPTLIHCWEQVTLAHHRPANSYWSVQLICSSCGHVLFKFICFALLMTTFVSKNSLSNHCMCLYVSVYACLCLVLLTSDEDSCGGRRKVAVLTIRLERRCATPITILK